MPCLLALVLLAAAADPIGAGDDGFVSLAGEWRFRVIDDGDVGLYAGHGFREQQIQLGAGDLLFFYTDGCVEAENEAGDMFGADRLEALLLSSATGGTDDVLARVESAVTAFRGSCELFDDATTMALKLG